MIRFANVSATCGSRHGVALALQQSNRIGLTISRPRRNDATPRLRHAGPLRSPFRFAHRLERNIVYRDVVFGFIAFGVQPFD